MNYRLQTCVVSVGGLVDIPRNSIVLWVKEMSCSTGGEWRDVLQRQYLKPIVRLC